MNWVKSILLVIKTKFSRTHFVCPEKLLFLKVLKISTKTPVMESFISSNIADFFVLQDAFERTLSQLFLLEFCENYRKSYFVGQQSKAGSEITQ